MTTDANPRTDAMRQRTLALVVDTGGKITQSHASADLSDAWAKEADILESLEADDHATILATRAERSAIS